MVKSNAWLSIGCTGRTWPTVMAFLIVSFWGSVAAAWQIKSGFTAGCHEHITLSGLPDVAGKMFDGAGPVEMLEPLFPPVHVFVDPVTIAVADTFADALGMVFDSDMTRLAAISLIAGVRYPDIHESSAYDFFVMRPLMLDDRFERNHYLRKSVDDWDAGQSAAAADARKAVEEQIALAVEVSARPLDKRFVTHRVAIDLYGELDVVLYEPLYRLGVALHTFEDSFAHTLRTDDLTGIVAVFNSVDAISGSLFEQRDGIAHSMAMDDCVDDAAEIAQTCAAASALLVQSVAEEAAGSTRRDSLAVLDSWLGIVPGCGQEDGYCDSKWLATARKEPFEPFVPMLLGCDGADAGSRQPDVSWLLLSAAVWMLRRTRRRT